MIPTERLEAASTPEVRFMETATGMPAAVKTWWYPGEGRGHEFIFPKDQARLPGSCSRRNRALTALPPLALRAGGVRRLAACPVIIEAAHRSCPCRGD